MRICVLLPDYSTSKVDYQYYDPPRDLSILLPDAEVDTVFLNKLTTYKQLKELQHKGYDVFVNLCEGYLEWEVPSIDVIYSLELLNLPFTGPTSLLYDPPKELMKYVAYCAGVSTPGYVLVRDIVDLNNINESLNFPLFVKPSKAGDSLGIDEYSKVNNLKELETKVESLLKEYDELLIEEYIAGLAIVLLFSIVVFRQRNNIRNGKKRSDELLLNILPEEVAEELKEKGSAEAKMFDDVTVMFTDFKGFTLIAEKLSAKELVGEINYCFSAFDNIIHKYGIEKIKTIGDAYMAAGGLPVENKTHAKDIVKAAIEINKFMEEHKQQRLKEGKEIFEIRIGIHTGPVVAGIVGIKKFAYDIWGDTVNLASRMESSGEAGKVNISGSTFELVKNDFTCTYRGKIQAKNKGEVDMYFVSEQLITNS